MTKNPQSEPHQVSAAILGAGLEHSPLAMLIVDRSGVVRVANQAILALLSSNRAQVVGTSIEQWLPDAVQQDHSNWVKSYFANPQQRRMGGGGALRARRADGAEIHCDIGLSPFASNDETWVVVSVIEHLPDNKREHIIGEGDRWWRVLESFGDSVWELNLKDDHVRFTERFLGQMGYQPQDISSGAQWAALVHPEDLAQTQRRFRDYVEGIASTFEAEFRMRNAKGEYLWFRSRARISDRDANGTPMNLIGVFQEIHETKLLEEKARDAERRWKYALEGAGDALWDWNLKTNEVYFSESWATMLGYKPGEIEPHINTWRRVAHPDDLAVSDAAVEAHLTGETDMYSAELRVLGADGDTKWVLDRGQVVEFDAAGKPSRMIGTHHDITKRKQREAEIQAAQERLELIASSVPGALYQFEMAENGEQRFSYLSAGAEKIYGLPRERILDDIDVVRERMNANDRAAMMASLERSFAAHEMFSNDYRLTVNGELRWLRSDAMPVAKDHSDGNRTWFGYVQDITDRKQQEFEISSAHVRLELIAQSVPGALYEFQIRADGSLAFPYFSQGVERIFGLSAESIVEDIDLMLAMIHPDDLRAIMENAETSFASHTEFEMEYRLTGERAGHWVHAAAVPIAEAHAEGSRVWLGYMHDITERKNAELEIRRTTESLKLANQELEQFAYVSSHDLRAPMRSVGSFANLLQRRYAKTLDKQGQDYLARIVGGATRSQQMLDDLLIYARSADSELHPQTLDLNEIFSEVLENLEQTASEANAEIAISCLPKVSADRAGLVRVFQNLIENSLKYQHDHTQPRVIVDARLENGRVYIEISDNGIGIPSKFHEEVFLPFKRLHGPQEYSGTGMGMAICRRVLERMSGTISIKPGSSKGTVIQVTLPVPKS